MVKKEVLEVLFYRGEVYVIYGFLVLKEGILVIFGKNLYCV